MPVTVTELYVVDTILGPLEILGVCHIMMQSWVNLRPKLLDTQSAMTQDRERCREVNRQRDGQTNLLLSSASR